MEEIQEKIAALAESIAEQHGVRVYDVEIVGNARNPFVRVYLDKEPGISLDECAKFSRSLAALVDVEDPIPTAFVLEVSSPGIDRQLKKLKHYEQSRGKLAKVVLKKKSEDGQNVVIGRIMDVQGDLITLISGDGQNLLIPFDTISRARLEIELK
ncbi:MAG: ribosome maturation factor RimP [Nitrospirota bacterium]|nr:ribosome maturation factor RimP [Nitrospirota bacterium]